MEIRDIPFNQLGKAGYNRPINRNRVNKIKRNWCDALENLVEVSFRDGRYWVVDHQHQAQAKYELNGCDPEMIFQCRVHTGLTYEQEAELFHKLNTSQVGLTFAELLVGLIEAKDPVALHFRSVIEECGYTIGDRGKNSVRAVRKLWQVFMLADGETKLTEILTLIHDCWPNYSEGTQAKIIDGILLFLKNHGDEYKRDHFVKALSTTDPKELVRREKAFYGQMNHRAYTHQYCMYAQLVADYNTGLKNRLVHVQPEY